MRPNQETSQQTNDWRQDEQTHIARPQIEQALKKEVSIDIEDGTLNEALKQLHDAAGVNITIDPGAIDDTGITTDERVSLHLAGVSLRSALKILLTPFRLTTLTEDEVLKVVSQQFAEGKLFVVAYQAEDLIQTNKDGEPEFESLIDLITNVVAPESWQVVGGLGALASNPTTTTLVIRQTQRIHGEIQQLFDALRQWNSDDPSVISTNEQPPILQQMMRRGAIVSGPQPPQQIGRTSYAETNPLHQVVSIDQKDEKARRRVAASGELHRRTTGD